MIPKSRQMELVEITRKLLEHEQIEVRQLASLTLSGLVQCANRELIYPLIGTFSETLGRVKVVKKRPGMVVPLDYNTQVVTRHASVLGLSALVQAFPYTVPEWVPGVFVILAKCIGDPAPICTTVSIMFGDFKRTHQDTWHQDKQ